MIKSKKAILWSVFLFLVMFGFGFGATANHRRHTRTEYIDMYKHIAIAHQQRYGIPASITMAQGILESDNGNSILARGSNNHFGIKCKSYWTGRTFTHTDDEPDECFRAYDTVEESYADHAEFLDSSPRYDSLFDFSPTDYKSWARALKNAGYATSPTYTNTLIRIIEDNKLYLLDIVASEAEEPSAVRLTAERSGTLVEQQSERAYLGTEMVDPNDFRTTISGHKGYNVYNTNYSHYVLAHVGDTYASVAKAFGLSLGSILRFNDVPSKDAILRAYDVVYIERKGSEWNGSAFHHVVERDETLRDISQSYGIRESSLRRLNKLTKSDRVTNGMSINLR